MWLFDSVDNYGKMVDKIAKTVFMFSLLVLYLISCINCEFKEFLETISFGATYEIFGVDLNLALFYLPIIMGVLEHVFKIHDKVSDLFRIRHLYDKYCVVGTLAKKIGVSADIKKLNSKQISKLMSKAFYKYASSTKPEIDSHCITLALTEWSWFWIVLDTGLLLLVLGIVFLALNWSWINFMFVVIGVVVILVFLFLILLQTIQYTKKEISAILDDSKRFESVKKDIEDALQG